MRYAITVLALMLFGCGREMTEELPTDAALTSALGADPNAPVAVFNTRLLAENELNGASTSESKGCAQVKAYEDGTLAFLLLLNNKDDETFTRAHIHKAASTANGGIHWDFLEAGDPVPSLGGQPAILRGTAPLGALRTWTTSWATSTCITSTCTAPPSRVVRCAASCTERLTRGGRSPLGGSGNYRTEFQFGVAALRRRALIPGG